MGQYYCMEIDPSGHVMDYSASYYRKFDYEWNFKSLEICSIKDEKGYIVQADCLFQNFWNWELI